MIGRVKLSDEELDERDTLNHRLRKRDGVERDVNCSGISMTALLVLLDGQLVESIDLRRLTRPPLP